MNKFSFYVILPLLLVGYSANAEEVWKIGVGKTDITPTEPVILSGYGSRTKPSEGVDTKLWARALAIGDEQPHLVIAVDNCGVPREIAEKVYDRINARKKLDRAAFVLCSTHTHNAPSLPGYAPILWLERAGEAELAAAHQYAQELEDRLVTLALEVLENQVDATLSWGQGKVTFGGNRRVLAAGKWANFGFQYDGPVDHSLPVMLARDTNGKLIAVWTNYACHCTTVGARNTIGGDWAGFANEETEKNYPQATALTTIGCGADIGPQPTGNLDLAARHGRAIAVELKRLIDASSELHTLTGALRANSQPIQLPFATVHDLAYWRQQAELRGFDGVLGRRMVQRLQEDGKLDADLPYTIATWQFGNELAILFLPGEVCVDYALRLKTEHDWRRWWINGWSNDVPCYIPSKRVLQEGGYEADFSMIYYDHPSRFADNVEDLIVSAAGKLLGSRFDNLPDAQRPDIFAHPAPEKIALQKFMETVSNYDDKQRVMLQRIEELTEKSQNGFAKLQHSDLEETAWYDYFGRNDKKRPYVRQQKSGQRVVWETPELKMSKDETILCFSGGLGWHSQPATDGFELVVGEKQKIKFDVTREIARWNSDDPQMELYYLPIWTSSEDSAGFFWLVIKGAAILAEGQPLTISVRSIGDGSQRWFAIDKAGDSVSTIKQVFAQLAK